MGYREIIIKEYFDSWINKDDSVLEKVFAINAKYIECYGPAYDGLIQIQKWFKDWQDRGSVLIWNINKFVHSGEDSVCDWYFECEYDGKIDGFNGVSWIKFNDENKIIEIREYQSKVPNYFPYNKK